MARSIILPREEDSRLNITCSDGNLVTVDAFELWELLNECNDLAKGQQTNWWDEFPSKFSEAHNAKITPGHALILLPMVEEFY